MIEIGPGVRIDEREIRLAFVRASGPGGQNVNKVASAVQLRFDVRRSPSLPADVKGRLHGLAGRRMTRDRVLVIEARRFRTQEQNRKDAVQRLIALVQRALLEPGVRRRTRPSGSARAARLDAKKQRGKLKRSRGSVAVDS